MTRCVARFAIGAAIAFVGCVLNFVALGVSPNTFTQPLSNFLQFRELPGPTAAVAAAAVAWVLMGALDSALVPV